MRCVIAALLLLQLASAFLPAARISAARKFSSLDASSDADSSSTTSVDVSDLGLTMADLNVPLPEGFLEGIEMTGYESTSSDPGINDDGCMWTETPEKMTVVFAITGLRGQPSMCFDTLTSTNTVSISAFGRVVWSCILRGNVKPETAVAETRDGADSIPIIEFEVEKATTGDRWGGFILQIGEDSLL
jgi:hypothetical protein